MSKTAEKTKGEITVRLDFLQEQTLWQIYFMDPSDENRNALVNQYYETACKYTIKAYNRQAVKGNFTKSEAISDMALRLLRAIPRFNPAKSDNFLAYFLSPYSLRGRIIDGAERCFKQDRQLSEGESIEGEYRPDSDTEFLDLCESRFAALGDLDYEIAQALVFEGSPEVALMRQLGINRARIKRVRNLLANTN